MALSDNLISHWSMVSSTTEADDHGANDLTAYDNPPTTSGPGSLSARDFEVSTREALYISSATPLNFGDVDFTIAAWANLESKTTGAVVAKWFYFSSSLQFMLNYNAAADRWRMNVSSNGTSAVTVNADNFGSPTTGNWVLLVGYHDAAANVIGISVNGGTPNTTSHSTGVYAGTSNLYIGAIWDTDTNFDGKIGPVAVWDRVLTSAEITALYNSGSGLTYAEILAYGSGGSGNAFYYQRNQ